MRPGERVRIRWCPAHPEAVGSVGVVVAWHEDLGGFGADVVEVAHEAAGARHVTPLAPGNVVAFDRREPAHVAPTRAGRAR